MIKKILLFTAVCCALGACASKTVQVKVTNPADNTRINEIVELDLTKTGLKPKNIVITDAKGMQVPYQFTRITDKGPQAVIFPAYVGQKQSSLYTLTNGTPHTFDAQTFGRHIPERKDDFAWENDKAAYRMYGPALAGENPSNGVDLWLKRTEKLIVNKFYKEELEDGLSYHIDRGQGLDCYKVGHTLGAGGVAPYYKNKLWVGNHYDTFKVLENGPLRTTFELTYNNVAVDNKTLKQVITISLDAYSNMNKAVVRYDGPIASMQLAPGIYLHDKVDNVKTDKKAGYAAYAENAVSDAGVPVGRNYVAVVVPGLKSTLQKDAHVLALADYKTGEDFTYYFGGGWSRWGFPSDQDWFNYVERYTNNLKNPLQVEIISQQK
ncbi:hypothetical protein AAIR98_000516 [Elusimicrobium simillimum]|uniref:DUF4861 family protein n=1 Tax=Elusimicrobium simillimum TaxID=3143438 RepID=UPI003C6EF889